MSLVEFEYPDWLKGQSARAINKRMMSQLPDDIDKIEGGFIWDLTMPSAEEKAELLQYHMILALKTMFHMWATGRWLDYHAQDCGLTRKEANKAYGYLTVTGEPNTKISQGFIFSVPSNSGEPAIDYATVNEAIIPKEGIIDIAVQAVVAGKSSNIANDKITIMRSPIKGITHITNKEAITGGAENESDDALRQRIDDVWAGRESSYVGNNADYKRWAMEVPGVGYAHVIPAENYNGPNSVKIVVVDSDGLPANEQICRAVYLHIFGTNRKDLARLAPVGLIDFSVVPPSPVNIVYSFDLKLVPGYTEDVVKVNFKSALSDYYATLTTDENEPILIKYVQASAVLAKKVEGVLDFKHFRMNGKLNNIEVQEDEYPVTKEIEVTALYE